MIAKVAPAAFLALFVVAAIDAAVVVGPQFNDVVVRQFNTGTDAEPSGAPEVVEPSFAPRAPIVPGPKVECAPCVEAGECKSSKCFRGKCTWNTNKSKRACGVIDPTPEPSLDVLVEVTAGPRPTRGPGSPGVVQTSPDADVVLEGVETSSGPVAVDATPVPVDVLTPARASPAPTERPDDSNVVPGAVAGTAVAGAGAVAGGAAAGGATAGDRPDTSFEPATDDDRVEESAAPADADATGVSGFTDGVDTEESPEESDDDPLVDDLTDEDELLVSPDAESEANGEESESACFNDAATVELEDGSVRRMDAVQLGDRVKVSSGEFSDVFMFTHKSADSVNKFVKIETTSGSELLLTSGHFLYVNGALSAAKTVRAGDSLELGTGARTTVESVGSVSAKGLYNPQTIHGDIIVNNVRASTYTTAVEPSVAHALLTPLRTLYKSLGFSSVMLDNGLDQVKSAL